MSLESSNEKAKVGRFIFAATVTETAFSTTVVVTASSITHQFCFSIANADDDCASNHIIAATGRKRRRSAIEEQPSQNWKLMLDNEEIDFNEFVAQFKPDPPRAPKTLSHVPQRLEFKRIEVEGLADSCFNVPPYKSGRVDDNQPRFVTFRTTVTTGTTSTTTVVTTTAGQITQSLWFSSTSGCFPSSILSSLSSIGPSLGQCG
jgi:hypothetical protein